MMDGRKRFDVVGHLALLRRYARSLTRHEADAEDLVHDALVRAYAREAEFRPDSDLRGWLLSITYTAFVDSWRSRQAERNRAERYAALMPRDEPAPQTEHLRLRQISEAFDHLPDEQRAVLHLVLIEGLSYEEVASALQIPIGTVMSRLGRGRAALRAADQATGTTRPGPGRPRLRIVGE